MPSRHFLVILLLGAATLGTAPPRTVRVAAVERRVDDRAPVLSGILAARRQAALSFLVGGRLATRPVEVGDPVARGQVLASLDDRELGHGVAVAEAALAEVAAGLAAAELEHARVRRLVAASAATAEELERVTAARDALVAGRRQAETGLAEARRQLGEARLTAPFPGVVAAVAIEAGELVAPGRPIMTITGAELEVTIEVPESMLPELAAGGPVELRFPQSAAMTASGRVRSIGRSSPQPGRLFPVVVDVDAGAGLVPGLAVEVVLPVRRGEETVVPLAAVVRGGDGAVAVLVVRDGRIVPVAVELGRLAATRLAVRGELAAGELVVVSDTSGFAAGDAVEIRR